MLVLVQCATTVTPGPKLLPPIRPILETVAIVLSIIAAAMIIAKNWPGSHEIPVPTFSLPAEPVALPDSRTEGSATARVAVIMYSDFQCPYCRRFALTTLPALRATYDQAGDVVWAFRHLPIESIHPNARAAAEAADCLARQGKFWETHDRLFQMQSTLKQMDFLELARSVGADAGTFSKCLDAGAADAVTADLAEAKALGISGTPAFLVGIRLPDGRYQITRGLTGARPDADFRRVIDQALGKRPYVAPVTVAVALLVGGVIGRQLWKRRTGKA